MSMIDQTLDKINQEAQQPIQPEPQPKPILGNIVDQITHFYKERPNTLQIEHTKPELVSGYPKDGNITVRLIKDKGSQAFKLNVNEAYRFANVILDLCELHRSVTKSLWDSRKEV